MAKPFAMAAIVTAAFLSAAILMVIFAAVAFLSSDKKEPLTPAAKNSLNQASENKNAYSESLLPCDNRKSVEAKIKETSDVRNLVCGGIINLPRNGSVFLKFKTTEFPGEEQRCLWTLHSNYYRRMYSTKIRISILCDKIGISKNTLTFYEWWPDEVYNLSVFDARNDLGQFVPGNSEWKYRYFLYLNSKEVLPQNEFILHIEVVAAFWAGTEQNWYFDTAPGRVDYNQFQKGRSTSIAVIPPKSRQIQFTVEHVESSIYNGICKAWDSLDIYELSDVQNTRLLGRLCGNITIPVSYCTENPVIAVFYQYSFSVGTFKISWKK